MLLQAGAGHEEEEDRLGEAAPDQDGAPADEVAEHHADQAAAPADRGGADVVVERVFAKADGLVEAGRVCGC